MRRRLLITGLDGTLAPRVAKLAKEQGYDIISWPMNIVDPSNIEESNLFLFRMNLDAIIHFANGPEKWAGVMSHFSAVNSIPFVYVSSVRVFSNRRKGPYCIWDKPDSVEDYGLYKIRCEQLVRNSNLKSCVIRIGWQIAPDGLGSSNMIKKLNDEFEKTGQVSCSSEWFPACSFMEDTANTIMKCVNERWYGCFHLDGNCIDKYSYYDLVKLLSKKFNKGWKIVELNDYIHDQRMKDDYLPVVRNSTHLE